MLEAPLSTPSAPATTRAKVLIIDDELGPRESMSYILQDEFEVAVADEVDRGLALLRATPFDVVIMDIRMPQKNGIQGLEELRGIDGDASVIMMTGYGALASAQAAISLGANEYLKKPFDVDQLIATVRRHAEDGNERRRRSQAFRQMETVYESIKTDQRKHQMQVGYGQAAAEMVHDICNPLVVTIGYANMLLEEVRLLPATGSAVKSIVAHAEKLERCAAFCLHLAEAWRQSSKHAEKGETFDLLAAADETRSTLFFDSPRIVVAGDPGARIVGVRFEIIRVLQNLLKNALESGATHIAVAVRAAGERVVLTVADNGPGLSPEQMAVILKKPVASTKPYGTGLGLTICRHIAGAHRAEMDVAARPEGGTVFTLTFPAATVA